MKITSEELNQVLETVGKTFKILSPRERKILLLRYGFEDGSQKTLEEVAKKERVTRERIRQLESRALEKMKLVLKYEE